MGKKIYGGLFMVTSSTLLLEILLTRIFSVTMWYHFAFMAISIAMFGMTVGAVAVYLLPEIFTKTRAKVQLSAYALLFACSAPMAFLVHLYVPFNPEATFSGLASVAITFGALSLPFVFSGICVTIALTRFPAQISKLYAADLAGAAIGSFLLYFVLGVLDGPTALVFGALLAVLGSLLFAAEADAAKMYLPAAVVSGFFIFLILFNTFLANPQNKLLAIRWVKGIREPALIYERWSSYARVAVRQKPIRKPLGWGLSDACPDSGSVDQLYLDIDAAASTVLTRFDGSFANLQYLKCDITNLVHYLRSRARVLVVGTGGGRDILSALAFGQKSVRGVEINGDIIRAVNKRFADFTGHLDRWPGVDFVNDEARSYLTRSRERFDIMQISLIDTWSATAAGAFVLAENSLYTVDAWKIFFERLSEKGILSVSRWFAPGMSGEMYRLTSLAVTTLRQMGIADPRRHIIIAQMSVKNPQNVPPGLGTLLLSRAPFTEAEIVTVQKVCRQMGFQLFLSPREALNSDFVKLTSARDADRFIADYPLNINAPTDESPFFFNMLRLRDVWKQKPTNQAINVNLKAVLILAELLVIIFILVVLCIGIPLFLTSRRMNFHGSVPFFVFFSCIGIGFMLVEISQMQRLAVFLGHPSYSLTVVLFSLLLAGSLGSFLTRRVRFEVTAKPVLRSFSFLLLALFIVGLLTPIVLPVFRGATTPLRILLAVILLFVQGIFMGMAFPMGMNLAQRHSPRLSPWYWGINGAASVFASVLAVMISLSASISASYWTGLAAYGAAFISVSLMARRSLTKVAGKTPVNS
jgi:hypothetical protein